MKKLKLCINNDLVLRKRCRAVSKFGNKELELFENMVETMYREEGIGLAAPQVGILKKILVVDVGDGPIKLANPKIIKKSGSGLMEEGCLSLPEVLVKIKRSLQVTVSGQNEKGEPIIIDATNMLARALQHEIDHLKGKLIIDYLPWLKRKKMSQKLRGKRGLHL